MADYWQDGAPKTLFEIATENIQEGRPIIPFVNGSRLRQKTRENGGVHSIVVAGYGRNQNESDIVAVHDPWGYPENIEVRPKLEDAWDPMFNQVIIVTLSKKGTKLVGKKQ